MKPPGGGEERGAGALLTRRPTAAGGKRPAEHCRQTRRRPGGTAGDPEGTAGTRRDAPRPRNPPDPQPAGGAPRYSHFVRQPRVRRQRDLEGNLGPEGERRRASGPCAATGARGARRTYMVRPARTQRRRPVAPQLPPGRRAARLAQGHVRLRSPGTSRGCRPGHCLKLGLSVRARRSLQVTSNS